MEFSDYANMVAQSVQQNNQWSAQQAAQQMAFQERMSNTAHQREMADLKAAGLNPVLSAKLGGASTPSGASASGDTSGTAALVDLIGMAMETANAAAGAAQAAAQSVRGSGTGRVSVSSPAQDNSAAEVSSIPFENTAAAHLGFELDKEGNYTLSKKTKDAFNKVESVVTSVPVIGSVAKSVIRLAEDIYEGTMKGLDKRYTFSPSAASQLEANRQRLRADNALNSGSAKYTVKGGRTHTR